jgi:hypothetical protein
MRRLASTRKVEAIALEHQGAMKDEESQGNIPPAQQ